MGTTFQILIRSKVKMNQEPRFVRKFKIQRSESSEKEEMDNFSLIRRVGGYMHLSSNNLIPQVDSNRLDIMSNLSFGSVLAGLSPLPDKFKILLVNDEPF